MSDFLLEMGEKPWFRKAVDTLGLPLPMPEILERGKGPWKTNELVGRAVISGGKSDKLVAKTLEELGTHEADVNERVHALVFDGRDIKSVAGLNGLYEFFHANVRRLNTSGRIVVISRAVADDAPAEEAAVAHSVIGFVKSIAKEVGKKGATANAILVAAGSESNMAGPLRFFLSPRSAYVDGQYMIVTGEKSKKKVAWENSLEGKTALVTGAARGIGAEIARRLGEEGAKVIGVDMENAADELARVLGPVGGHALTLDITKPDAVTEILEAGDKFGGIQIVVNNAGITRDKTIANMDADRWNAALNVNLKAALDISEAVLERFDGDGRVIFLSSIAGIAGNFGQTNYAAAKSGIIGAVKHLGPKFEAKGATVNAVAPGFIETRLTAAIPFVTREAARRLSNLGQGGLPVDVAELITFLVTPGASGVNGQVIRACGGNYVGA